MLVVNQKFGQLCNRIFLHSHLMAYAIENNFLLINPSFEEYSYYFKGTFDNPLCSYPINFRCLPNSSKFRHYYFNGFRKFHYDGKIRHFLQNRISIASWVNLSFLDEKLIPEDNLYQSKLSDLDSFFCFFEGWLFRSFNLFKKHQQTIKNFFTPIDQISKEVFTFMSSLNQYTYKVGVHIRHGDYKDAVPEYYYSIDQYTKWIRQLLDELGDHVCFVISTNSNEAMAGLQNYPCYFCSGHEVTDLYILSNCTHIMGPPSTYNRWAAFYGNVKHLNLQNQDQEISISSFDLLKACDKETSYSDLSVKQKHLLNYFGIV